MIKLKRIYDNISPDDGRRILVDRLWPRGINKEGAKIDDWVKEIAPSNELRKWFSHKPSKWEEFRRRYREELMDKKWLIERLRLEAMKRTITLLYAAKDRERNNAVVLKEVIEEDI
jgi:uncharacterized protein YeaO (DUF488 family)